MDESYFINPNIFNKYDLETSSLQSPKWAVVINSEKNNNNDDIYLKQENKGKLWIIKKDNSNPFLLIPSQKHKFNISSHQHLKPFFELDKYENNQQKKFILLEPAIVYYNGMDWQLEKKGILDFGGNSSSSFLTDFRQQSNNQKSKKFSEDIKIEYEYKNSNEKQNSEKQRFKKQKKLEVENEKLKNHIQELKKQLDQEKNNQPVIEKQELSIDLKSIEELIEQQISKSFQNEFNNQLKYFKGLIKDLMSDRTAIKLNNESEDIKQLIREGISEYFQQEIDNPSKSIHHLVKQELSQYIKEYFDVHVGIFQRSIHEKIIESFPVKSSNELECLQDKLNSINEELLSINNKIQEKQTNNINIGLLPPELNNQLDAIKKIIEQFKNEVTDTFTFLRENTFDIQQQIKLIKNQSEQNINETNDRGGNLNTNISQSFGENNDKSTKKLLNHKKLFYEITDLQSLIDIYNTKPSIFSERVTKVAATKESIEQRRAGIKTPIIFTKTSNDSYWIINELLQPDNCLYLVPKANLVVNNLIFQTIEDIFICQGYFARTSNNFKLNYPAIVQLYGDSENEWKLVQPGELLFS